jgi:hypothetical protein
VLRAGCLKPSTTILYKGGVPDMLGIGGCACIFGKQAAWI